MNNNNWLDIDVLEDYLDGKLDAKAMHYVEKLSLEDPFVAEALAGLSQSPKRVQTLSLLQKQLQDRIAQKPVEQQRWRITSQRLSIAAASAVLFVTVSLLFWMREHNNREQLAANSPKKIEVSIAPIPEKQTPKTSAEVDKVIAEAKSNSYAIQSKKAIKKPKQLPIATLMQAPTPVVDAEKKESVARSSIKDIQSRETLSKEISPALQGKVAGVNVAQPLLINGVVYGEDKLPVIGASVKLKGSSLSTSTNAKGEFSLRVDSILNEQKLSIAYLGYLPKEVNVQANENLSIELTPNNNALNEVVTTAYGKQKRQEAATAKSSSKALLLPEPVGGWEKFEEYVVNNNKLLINKKLTGNQVTVNFELDKNGNAIRIKAINSIKTLSEQTAAQEKEAIRLVKEGPKWILPTKSGSSPIAVTVNIKF